MLQHFKYEDWVHNWTCLDAWCKGLQEVNFNCCGCWSLWASLKIFCRSNGAKGHASSSTPTLTTSYFSLAYCCCPPSCWASFLATAPPNDDNNTPYCSSPALFADNVPSCRAPPWQSGLDADLEAQHAGWLNCLWSSRTNASMLCAKWNGSMDTPGRWESTKRIETMEASH